MLGEQGGRSACLAWELRSLLNETVASQSYPAFGNSSEGMQGMTHAHPYHLSPSAPAVCGCLLFPNSLTVSPNRKLRPRKFRVHVSRVLALWALPV